MTCDMCEEPKGEAGLYFQAPRRGKIVRVQLNLCNKHGEMLLKHLKRMVPGRLFTSLLLVLSLLVPVFATAQTPDLLETIRELQVRQRGAIRQAETYGSQIVTLLPPPPGPPVVLDWREGVWDVMAAGFHGKVDLDALKATYDGLTVPVLATAHGDTLKIRLNMPGLTQMGLIELVHAEGRMIGTVTRDTISRPATAQRLDLRVVRTVTRQPCQFAQYTDGSWGVAPNNSACHQALAAYLAPTRLQFVAREYTP